MVNEWVSYVYVRIEQLVYTLARNAVSSPENVTRKQKMTPAVQPELRFDQRNPLPYLRSNPPTIPFTSLLPNTTEPFSHNHPEGSGANDIFDLFGGKHE